MKKILSQISHEKSSKRFQTVYLILLLALILVGWGYFLNWGNIPMDFHDWAEVNGPRLAFLKDALTKGRLPLHMPDPSALRGVTDRYLSLPDMILSPQVLLLRWMSVGTFVLVHTWLLIGLGYWGLIRLKQRFSLSLLSFTWIALLFFFNGHIISHFAVGHVTWGGVFLFSWFAELVFALIDGDLGIVWEARMAFLLFAVFLQGSFHQFVWCVIFLGFLAISNWKLLFTILRSGIYAALLSMFRIIPPALEMGAFDDDFLGGYQLLIQVFNAFVKIISPANSLDQRRTGAVQGWWEFDIFIGLSGVLVVFLGLVVWLLLRQRKLGFPALLCPLILLTVFSYKDYYQLMRFFRIPLFSGERVSSRFLILPLFFMLVAGMAALQQWMRKKRISGLGNVLLCAGLVPAVMVLWMHLDQWKVTEAAEAFPEIPVDLSLKTVANHPDRPYTTALLIGCAVSLITAAVLLICVRRHERNQAAGQL